MKKSQPEPRSAQSQALSSKATRIQHLAQSLAGCLFPMRAASSGGFPSSQEEVLTPCPEFLQDPPSLQRRQVSWSSGQADCLGCGQTDLSVTSDTLQIQLVADVL